MKVAIDKNTINQIKDLKEHEYLYIYGDDEKLEDLLKLNMHCIHKDYALDIDVNLSRFNLTCFKKANIQDEQWDKMPEKFNYKYAIIIPSYNNDHGNYEGKTFLRNCIESVLNQTYTNYELIIVDDMSTDTSIETIKSYKDDRIHLIQNNRKRYNGGSRNVGIDYARTTDADYICFLDSDDWWKHNKVLEHINRKMYNHELMLLGCEGIGIRYKHYNKAECYEDLYSLNSKVWCTAWSRVIRKDKIVYFCEDTLMEDRVWTYRLADNINFNNVINLNEIVYCWNRTNTGNSVSMVRSEFWDACAYCHIGHQKQLITQMKHKEMIPKIKQRIDECIRRINGGRYEQY